MRLHEIRLESELEAIAAPYAHLFDTPVQLEFAEHDGLMCGVALVRLEEQRGETTTRQLVLYADVAIPDEGLVDVDYLGNVLSYSPEELAREECARLMSRQLERRILGEGLVPVPDATEVRTEDQRIAPRYAHPVQAVAR